MHTLRDRFFATDPGLQQTHLASRATLAVAIALAAALPLSRAIRQSITFVLLAVVVAMMASVAVSGASRAEQMGTAVLAWIVAECAVTLGVALAPYTLANHAVFVLVMVAGTWARRFGPRGLAGGMIGFIVYFFGLFIGASFEQLPYLLVAVGIGFLVMGLVRFVLLPDHPALQLRHLLIALRVRTRHLDERATQEEKGEDEDFRQRLRRASLRVDDVALQIRDHLKDTPDVVADKRRFNRHLFAVVTFGHHLVLETLQKRGALRHARRVDPHDTAPPPPHGRSDATGISRSESIDKIDEHLTAMEMAATNQARDRETVAPPDMTERRQSTELLEEDPGAPSSKKKKKNENSHEGLSSSTRTALQVALAGAVSIAAGSLLSSRRWYWAAFAAFVVFANTDSRAATLRKATERIIGTAVGVAAGLLLGYVLAGHGRLELAAIFPILFVGFWILQRSYAVMIGFITVLLALFYGLMGMLTTEVLLLRLYETVLGATIGAAVAFLVLPTPTRRVVDEAFDNYLSSLDDLLETVRAAATGPAARSADAEADVLATVRTLDQALNALRDAARPAVLQVPGPRSRTLHQNILLTLAIRYWAYRLVTDVLYRSDPTGSGPIGEEDLTHRIDTVRQRIGRMRNQPGSKDPPARQDLLEAREASPLLRIDEILSELAQVRATTP